MRKSFTLLITLSILVSMLLPSISSAQEMEGNKVIMVIANHINISDINHHTPNMAYIAQAGGIALTNTRSAGTASISKAYVTIGAGTRAEGNPFIASGVNVDQEIQRVYFRRMGVKPELNRVVNLELNRLIKLNTTSEYRATPGALGQNLMDKGLYTAVLGNSDYMEEMLRPAVTIGMDMEGQVSYGNVEQDILMEDELAPFGIRTDYQKLLEQFRDVQDKASLIIIETGDLTRLENYRDSLSEQLYQAHRKLILERIDGFIGQLISLMDISNARLYVVSPYPSYNDIALGNRLTPTIIYGDGVQASYLRSGTTKRQGIIANIDIAPSIAKYLGADTQYMVGSDISQIAVSEDKISRLTKMNNNIVNVSINRWPVLSTFSIFQIILVCSTVLSIMLYKYTPVNLYRAIETLLLATMGAPIALLLLGAVPQYGFVVMVFLFFGISLIISYLVKLKGGEKLDWIWIISALTAITVIIDVITGSNLIKYSLFGYDPIIGARYYGIGNEFVGVVIGSSLVAITSLIDKNRKYKKCFWFVALVVILTLGYPKLGANVGGTITAVFSFVYLSFKLSYKKVKLRHVALSFFAVVGVVALLAMVDVLIFKGGTHLGRTIMAFSEGGPAVVFSIIYRKLSMNIRLIRVTLWSWVLLAIIVSLWAMFRNPKGILLKIFNQYPYLFNGWVGVTIASMVGFIFNDSGIVVAATSTIYMAASLLLLAINYTIAQKVKETQ